MGERSPLAIMSPKPRAMSVGEALTNLAAAPVGELNRVKLSANWMDRATGRRDAALFDTVRAVASSVPALGISIPVGRIPFDAHAWDEGGKAREVIAPCL